MFTQILWGGRQRKACGAAAGNQNLQEIHSPDGNPCSALALVPDYAQVVDLIHPGEAKQRGGVCSRRLTLQKIKSERQPLIPTAAKAAKSVCCPISEQRWQKSRLWLSGERG